jgi:hypothetical protein
MTDSNFRPNFDRAAPYPELVTLRAALRAHDWGAVRALYDPADWDTRNLLISDASDQEDVQSFLRDVVTRDRDDLVAATMLATRTVVMGWGIRTTARAKNVSAAQFRAFFEHLREAEQVLISVCARDPGLTSAWCERLVTARGLQLGLSEARRRYARLAEVTPHFAPAQSQLLQMLCPKWSGDFPTMHAFATQCVEQAPAGSLSGVVVVEGHLEHWLDLKGAERDQYLDDAVRDQIRAAGERSVLHADFRHVPGWVGAMSTFALGYSVIGDWTAAKRCFTELGPFASERYWENWTDGADKHFLRNRAKAMEQG